MSVLQLLTCASAEALPAWHRHAFQESATTLQLDLLQRDLAPLRSKLAKRTAGHSTGDAFGHLPDLLEGACAAARAAWLEGRSFGVQVCIPYAFPVPLQSDALSDTA